MLGALRAREADILRFVGFLVAGLGVFFYTFYQYMKHGYSVADPNNAYALLLLIGSGFAVVILTIGNVYASALGYNFRSILLYICKLERGLGIERYRPKKWPNSSEKPKAKFFPPELIGVFWWSFLLLILAICTVVGLLLWNWPYVLLIKDILIASVIFCIAVAKHYQGKLNKLYNDEYPKNKISRIDSSKKPKNRPFLFYLIHSYWWCFLVLVMAISITAYMLLLWDMTKVGWSITLFVVSLGFAIAMAWWYRSRLEKLCEKMNNRPESEKTD